MRWPWDHPKAPSLLVDTHVAERLEEVASRLEEVAAALSKRVDQIRSDDQDDADQEEADARPN